MKDKFKILLIFILVFYSLVAVVYSIANQKFPYRKLYFPKENLFFAEHPAGDPCSKTIYGEPLRANDNYIKVNFYCDQNHSSKNTVSLNVIVKNNVENVIDQITRINNFKLDSSFKCYYEGKLIDDFETKIFPKKTIDCLSPSVKITDIYKNEIQ